MNLITLPKNPLRGSVVLPGDKSISHRAALFASLAYGESCIQNFLLSGVTRVMLAALKSLGVDYQINGNILIIQGSGLKSFQTPAEALNCGTSATTLRLMAGALAGSGRAAILDGSPGLRNGPWIASSHPCVRWAPTFNRKMAAPRSKSGHRRCL